VYIQVSFEEGKMRNVVPHTVKDRQIDSSVLVFDTDREGRMLKAEPEWIAGERNGITLAKYPHLRTVLIALKKGTRLREHRVEGPMALYLLTGKLAITVNTNEYLVRNGGLFTLRKTIPHDVRAVDDSTFLMTIVRL
jgi:quercetin dioxygenase-like cupin family protein